MPDTEALRTLAANLAVGWEDYTDPTRVAYGQAFRESARRILQLLADEGFDGFSDGERRILRREMP